MATNLLEGPDGRLSNLSGVSAADADGVWHVPLFPPASVPSGRRGLVRVINRSDRSGTISAMSLLPGPMGGLAYPSGLVRKAMPGSKAEDTAVP